MQEGTRLISARNYLAQFSIPVVLRTEGVERPDMMT
jgi:hypothetical protein